MSPVSSDQVGRVLGGRYRLVALLGVGASARVYLAEDNQLHRRVAVKVLHDPLAADPVVRRRFATEARAAAALNHPHLLAVYDVGEDDGTPYLVTEYLAGGSLRALLDRGHRLTPSQALLVGLEAVRGLEHAHRAGLVHRDVKPANLLFGADGRLRIADFGLAKVLAEAALTEPSASPLGTARYASPEQARGEAVSPATDVYSLALVLVEAVTGSVPFAGDHPIGGLVSRTERSLDVPPELGPLRGALERAGRLDPAERPDAGELSVSLLAAAEGLPRPAPLPLEIDRTIDGGDVPLDDAPTLVAPAAGATTLVEGAMVVPAFGEGDDEVLPVGPHPPLPPVDPLRPYDQAMEDDGAAEPRRGLALLVALVLLLGVAAGGAYAWWRAQPPTDEVPQLVGRHRDELDALVGEYGWDVEINETRVDGTEAGEIVDQDPDPGVELAEGDSLLVVVSLGNTLVAVPPDLVGASLDDATAALEDAGLVVGEVTRTHDEDAPADQVLAVGDTIVDTDEVPRGTVVDLTVSDGPAPRTVPSLAGMSQADATAALQDLGLVAEVDERASREVDEGIVIESTPAEGATVARGDTVTIVVSSGLPWINLPDVSGMSVAEATAALEEANLVVAGVEGPPNRDVVATSPEAGAPIQEGREVTLITRRTSSSSDSGD